MKGIKNLILVGIPIIASYLLSSMIDLINLLVICNQSSVSQEQLDASIIGFGLA